MSRRTLSTLSRKRRSSILLGAGDAFAGGELAVGKSLDEAVEVGHTSTAMCAAQVGPHYEWPKLKVLV